MLKQLRKRLNDLAHDIRGQGIGLGEMPQTFVLVGVAIFALVLMAVLVQTLQGSTSVTGGEVCAAGENCTAAFNVSTQGLGAFTNAGTLLPILGLTVMGVVAIGVLFMLFKRNA